MEILLLLISQRKKKKYVTYIINYQLPPPKSPFKHIIHPRTKEISLYENSFVYTFSVIFILKKKLKQKKGKNVDKTLYHSYNKPLSRNTCHQSTVWIVHLHLTCHVLSTTLFILTCITKIYFNHKQNLIIFNNKNIKLR